ncbi:hypothetical protein MuYL_1631 [Mucilaginibacter xinganensis]|uniref:Uncharacterized protein n=1 Tax=Mucilaginibacter xinganensis TaxID=1234841 RepID=A0A223NUF4_9SPHI|nr:hypothetical protein MuYL_1631 [Mucilaginibacter xinganensis]
MEKGRAVSFFVLNSLPIKKTKSLSAELCGIIPTLQAPII